MAETHRQARRRRWPIVLGIVPVLLMGWFVWTLTHAGDPDRPGLARYAQNGFTFTYPSSWEVRDKMWPSGTIGSTVAVLGTQPWGLCLPMDINCHFEQRLGPGQISVDLSVGLFMFDFCEIGSTASDLEGRGPDDPVAARTLLRVDGRPTLQTDYAVGRKDYYGSDEWRQWTIASPGRLSSVVGISARYQGSDVHVFRGQLDDLVASFRFTEPPAAVEPRDDCGPPFP